MQLLDTKQLADRRSKEFEKAQLSLLRALEIVNGLTDAAGSGADLAAAKDAAVRSLKNTANYYEECFLAYTEACGDYVEEMAAGVRVRALSGRRVDKSISG